MHRIAYGDGDEMTCPHESPAGNAIACAVLRATGGPSQVAGPGMAHYPCDQCRAEWTGDTPPTPGDEATYTPTIKRFLDVAKRFANASPPTKPPSARERIAAALAAIRRFIASGGKLLDAEAEKSRRLVCDRCEFRDGRWCTRCGCFLWAKRRLPEEHCPLAKWAGDPPGGCGRC